MALLPVLHSYSSPAHDTVIKVTASAAVTVEESATKLAPGDDDTGQGAFSSSCALKADEVFTCPITQAVMKDPVVAFDGYTYERAAMQKWLTNHDTSPMTNTRLESKLLLPNHAVRGAIAEWRERQPLHVLHFEEQQALDVAATCGLGRRDQGTTPTTLLGRATFAISRPTSSSSSADEDLALAGAMRRPCKYYSSVLAAAGDLPGLKAAMRDGEMWGSETCAEAARGGHLEVLQWLHSHGCTWDARTCAAAARGGHMWVLQWVRGRSCPWDARTCSMAAAGGHLAVLKWARESGCRWDAEECWLWASKGGHENVVRWIEAERAMAPGATRGQQQQQECAIDNVPFSASTMQQDLFAAGVYGPGRKYHCSMLAAAGDLPALQKAREAGAQWGSETCAAAAEGGHLEVLEWAKANGCSWDARTCAAAARGGHMAVLQWARAKGCPWDARTCSMAAAGGHIAVLRYARDYGCKYNSEMCRLWASKNGHSAAVQWIQAKRR